MNCFGYVLRQSGLMRKKLILGFIKLFSCNGKFGLVTQIVLFSIAVIMFCNILFAHSDVPPLYCLGGGVDKFNVMYAAPSSYTCAVLGCHYQYTVNSGKGKFRLYVLDKCKPGETVDILVTFEKTDTEFHGFQIAAQDNYFNRLIGTFINVGDDEDTQIEAGGRFASHTKKGTGQKFWHVKWQAPPAGFWVANPVKFYAMGVEANNDETSMGDYVYKATRLIVVESKKTPKPQVQPIKKK